MDHPIVRADDRGLPDRGDGRRRLPRGAARPEGRVDRAARRRHGRAVGVRARHPRPRSPTRSSTTRRSRSGARRRSISRRVLDPRSADEIGILDPEAIARVREEAWPQPANAEEVHEALLWMGYVTAEEGRPWQAWLDELAAAGRVVARGRPLVRGGGDARPEGRAARPPGGARARSSPDDADDALLLELEADGVVLRTRIDGRAGWCDRRLLARIHRYTLDRLRKEIEPVTASQFLRFLACWQHVDPEHRLDGPRGVAQVVAQLAGFEVPAARVGGSVLPARVRGYRREWLDQLTLSGEVVWGRLWGGAPAPTRRTPVCLVDRARPRRVVGARGAGARAGALGTRARGPARPSRAGARCSSRSSRAPTQLPPTFVEEGLSELIALGRVTCDSFSGLRWLIVPASKTEDRGALDGTLEPPLARGAERPRRPSSWRAASSCAPASSSARRSRARSSRSPGATSRASCARSRRAARSAAGASSPGFDGEQYALPEAVALLRAVRESA